MLHNFKKDRLKDMKKRWTNRHIKRTHQIYSGTKRDEPTEKESFGTSVNRIGEILPLR